MTRRTAVIAALVGYTLVFHAGNVVLRDRGTIVHLWADLGWTLSALIAAWMCWLTARKSPVAHVARAWRWIAAGCASWFVGMLIWDWLELVRREITPFPSVGDFFFLGLVPLVVVGFAHYRSEDSTHPVTWKRVGDLGVVLCTMLMACSLLLYRPAFASDETATFISWALAYPVVHITGVVFGLLCYWQQVHGNRRRVLLWLILGLVCLTVVAVLYAISLLEREYSSGGNLDVLWVMAFALIAFAAWEERSLDQPTVATSRLPELDVAVTGVAVASVGLAILAAPNNWSADLAPVIGGGLIALAVSLAIRHRASSVFEREVNAELAALNEGLEQRVADRTTELAEARDVAEAANQMKTRFLANMSHELRTPLTGIIGYAEMLKEDAQAASSEGAPLRPAEMRHDLAQIEVAGHQLLDLINELLDLSKIESGRFEPRIEPVDLPELIAEVEATVVPLIERNRNQISVTVAPELTTVQTDRARLRQVLLNLSSNAAKFTRDGRVEIRARARDGVIELDVSDTGIGMTAEQLERVFEPFEQAESTTNRDFGGTGLGLAISRSLVEVLGGDLQATSAPGEGSVFTVSLPRVRVERGGA